ncbi:hypothetical protein AX17_005919 [Amanita inopinata Kibby_2008]|nr:hypothetical protein AX17_005919 [Amanita inopinata Kibby_2008]
MLIVFHIPQAACANVKRAKNVNVNEATWRHDYDTLLRHLFKQSAATSDLDKGDSAVETFLETKLRFAKRDTLESWLSDDMLDKMQNLTYYSKHEQLKKWILDRGGQDSEAKDENNYQIYVSSKFRSWSFERTEVTEKMILQLGEDPSTGTCDMFGYLLVTVPSTLHNDLDGSQLVQRGDARSGKCNSCAGGKKVSGTTSQSKHTLRGAETTEKFLVPSQPASKKSQSGSKSTRPYHIPAASLSSTTHKFADNVDTLDAKLQDMKIVDFAPLELPIVVVEHKRQSEQPEKATNQMRMYLISAAKFLAGLGITGIPVFGIQTDGRYAFLPAVVLKDDGIIHLFERQVEKLDLSTLLGAWHYATVISRLADEHSKRLQNAFDKVKDNLHKHRAKLAAWTIDHQRDTLVKECKVKYPERS